MGLAILSFMVAVIGGLIATWHIESFIQEKAVFFAVPSAEHITEDAAYWRYVDDHYEPLFWVFSVYHPIDVAVHGEWLPVSVSFAARK
ncbi:MAG: hypothetical protein Q8O94_02895 [bacterium]|nr:hypothetical protein [bacterium]